MTTQSTQTQLQEIALRIREMRDILGYSVQKMAQLTEVSLRSIERRKMWFDIEVNDENGKCGEGSHLRIMVPNKDRS